MQREVTPGIGSDCVILSRSLARAKNLDRRQDPSHSLIRVTTTFERMINDVVWCPNRERLFLDLEAFVEAGNAPS
jgi:hypothetical protein